jgi:hypothetical protein
MAEALRGRAVKGSPQQVADEMKCRVLDVGVDGIIVNLPTHRYTPGVFTAVGELSRPWLRRIDVRSADAAARVTDRLAR